MYKLFTKTNETILCEESDLNKILYKLGPNFKSCEKLKRSKIASRHMYAMRFKKTDVDKFKQRAHDLGLESLAAYIKILLLADWDHHLLQKGADIAAQSKYDYK